MNAKRYLLNSFTLAALLTLGTGPVAARSCSPSTYAYCWEQREMCLNNVGDEDFCNAEYFDCLARRGCG
jgi:hypothetical protein